MIYLLPPSLITTSLLDKTISVLKNKTNMFDYIDEDNYRLKILNTELAIWITNETVIIGQFKNYETGLKALSVTVANVTDEAITDFYKHLEEFEKIVKGLGIDRIILDGRKGWIRKLPDYSLSSVILIKDL